MNSLSQPETLIYGGSFNPPTLAHKAIVEECLSRFPGSKVWLMPSGPRWDKGHEVESEHRLNMTQLMLDSINSDRVSISTLELSDRELTQTYKTVGKLAMLYPNKQFRYVFGADCYQSMPIWQEGERLQRELPMLIAERDGIEVRPADNIEVIQGHPYSSTDVREAVAKGDPVDDMVCPAVAKYIREHRLYRK